MDSRQPKHRALLGSAGRSALQSPAPKFLTSRKRKRGMSFLFPSSLPFFCLLSLLLWHLFFSLSSPLVFFGKGETENRGEGTSNFQAWSPAPPIFLVSVPFLLSLSPVFLLLLFLSKERGRKRRGEGEKKSPRMIFYILSFSLSFSHSRSRSLFLSLASLSTSLSCHLQGGWGMHILPASPEHLLSIICAPVKEGREGENIGENLK